MIWRRWRELLDKEEQLALALADRDRLSQEVLHQSERIHRLGVDNDRLRHRMGILHPDEDVEYDTRPYRSYIADGVTNTAGPYDVDQEAT